MVIRKLLSVIRKRTVLVPEPFSLCRSTKWPTPSDLSQLPRVPFSCVKAVMMYRFCPLLPSAPGSSEPCNGYWLLQRLLGRI
jgi:hypothetical protein